MARTGPRKTSAPTSPTRQDQWYVRCVIAGQETGAWDKKTGGEVDSDDNKYYPGSSVDVGSISIGGRATTGNITLQRIYDRDDDHTMLQTWINVAGKGSAKVFVQPKDENGNGKGKAIIYNGKLKRVSPPDFDSESGTAALVEIEIIVDGKPHVGENA